MIDIICCICKKHVKVINSRYVTCGSVNCRKARKSNKNAARSRMVRNDPIAREKEREYRIQYKKRLREAPTVANMYYINPLDLCLGKAIVDRKIITIDDVFFTSVFKAFEKLKEIISILVKNKLIDIYTASAALCKAQEYRMYYSRECKDEYNVVTFKL